MRAALLTSPTTFTVTDLPVPQPGPGEVRVRVAICGVCNSEVRAVRNLRTLHAPSRYTIEQTPAGPQPGRHLPRQVGNRAALVVRHHEFRRQRRQARQAARQQARQERV